MALNKIKTSSLDDDSVTSAKLANGAVTANDISDGELPLAKLSQVNLDIAPEVLEIQVSAPQAGQDTQWLWTWLTSSLPYARRDVTNSPEVQVPLYKQGTYTVNNFAAYDLFDDMTQTHSLYLKWIDGAGTDNLISWATSAGPVSDSHPDINGGSATDVQRISISVPTTITPPTLVAPSVSYTVTNNGSGAYAFSGAAKGDNPNIGPMYRGGTYTFNVSATGHPLYFTTDNGTNYTSGGYFGEYTDGVTGSRTDDGTVTIVVPVDAPDTLYYQCGVHGAMRGAITIKDLAVETNINGNYVVYFQHTQEGHKTPVELRPIPSLVNQMCLVYDASTDKFVPQDLATYVENTPSFENKIREVAGTAELVVEDGSAVIAKVNVYDDSTYLPLTGNNPGDQAFATDTDILYIWDGSAWQQAGAANTDDLAEGSTNLFYTDARVGEYLSSNGYDTATNIVASITDSAPATLDTLNELAAALGDDPNFATTVSTNIGTKVSKSGDTMTGDLTFGDNDKAIFGAGSNLQIFHDPDASSGEGSVGSYIKESGTGDLRIRASNLQLQSSGGERYMTGVENGTTTLFYDDTAKLATTSGGINVEGNLTLEPTTATAHGQSTQLITSAGNGYYQDLRISANDYDFRYGPSAWNSAYSALQISSTGNVVFNESGLDADFRIESSANNHCFFVDSGSDAILMGKTAQSIGATGVSIVNGQISATVDGGNTLRLNRITSPGSTIQFRYASNIIGGVDVDSLGVTYNTTSDRRLKENIELITDGKEKLLAMSPVTYNFKSDQDKSVVSGFIAQEMQEVVPEAVTGDPDGDDMMSMDYGRITPTIVAALQDALKEIEELKTRINELEAK